MRYWLILSEFPPAFGGGIATYGREITAALRKAGHEVTVFVPAELDQQQNTTSVTLEGAQVIRVALTQGDKLDHAMMWWQLFSYRVSNTIAALIEQGERPDVIEVQDYGAAGYYLLKRRLLSPGPLRQIPIVMFCHSPIFEIAVADEVPAYKFPSYGIGRTEKFCLMAVDKVICPSHYLAARLQRFRSDKIAVIRTPYDIPTMSVEPIPQRRQFDLLYLGKTQYLKGIAQLLNGLELAWASGSRARLRVVGGDALWQSRGSSLRDYLRQKHKAAISASLLVLDDAVGPDQIANLYASARVAVVPSLYDNFPYSCVEAMANGVPVIGSRQGGHAEILAAAHQGNQEFDVNDPQDIARVIVNTLARSSEELSSAGLVGRQTIGELCSPAGVVALREKHLKSIVPSEANPNRRRYPFVNDVERNERVGALLSASLEPLRESDMPLLSVVVPYFNLAETIEETIGAIMGSDYAEIEVIIVDDGSTAPNAIERLALIEATPHRFPVRVARIKNAGLANARNVGASLAKGQLLAFVDADDIVAPSYYSKAVEVLRSFDNVSYVYSWVDYFEGSSGCWVTYDTDLPYLLAANMTCATIVIRATDYLQFGGNSPIMKYGMEDYETSVELAAGGRLGVSLPELLTRYRLRAGSMSAQFHPTSVTWLYERLGEMNPAIFREWGDQLAQLTYTNGPGRLWNNFAVSHGEVGFAEGGSGYNFRVLATTFSPTQQQELVTLLNDPLARGFVRVVLATRLHLPVLKALRFASRTWRGFISKS